MYNPRSSMQRCNLMLDLVAQRQRALGMNIANVDTPGYVRKDIDFADYLGSMGSRLETDLSAKLGPSGVKEKKGEKVSTTSESKTHATTPSNPNPHGCIGNNPRDGM